MNIDTAAESKPQIESDIKERRSPERLEDDRKFRIHEAWLESLDERVGKGLLKPGERNKRIALASLRKEKKYLKEKEKNTIDPMSGLVRQEHLRGRLDDLMQKGKPFALLFTDLDKFSEFNERYGHPAGDELIAQSGLRIWEGLRNDTPSREGDEIYIGDPFRNGGDESAVVLPGVDNTEKLALIGNRIRSLINDIPFTVPITKEKVKITVSIGGIIWDGKQSRENFMKSVDDYLYKAKETRNSFAL